MDQQAQSYHYALFLCDFRKANTWWVWK